MIAYTYAFNILIPKSTKSIKYLFSLNFNLN